jgi:uncharacterized protein (TIGR02186 family)
MNRNVVWKATAILIFSAVAGTPIGKPAASSLKISPQAIEIGSFYRGAPVSVEGRAERGAEVIVVVRGPNNEETFNRKARAGPIWVTSGRVHVSGVPSLFLRFSRRPVESFLNPETIEKYQLAQSAIERQMRVEPKEADNQTIRANYLTLKSEQGFYRVFTGAINMGDAGNDGVPYRLEFEWPKKAPPESYQVSVYYCRDGVVVQSASVPLKVVKVGFPADMAILANERASLYGAIAVIGALLAGFGIDFLAARLFGKRRVISH